MKILPACHRSCRSLVFALCGGLLALCADLAAAAAEDVYIGVLAKRGAERAIEQWQPTADYLSSTISGYRFHVVPLGFDDIHSAAAAQRVDFVLANPAFYVELEARQGAVRIATLKNRVDGRVSSVFGGVVFARKGRTDLSALADLKGKRLMAVEDSSLGGFYMVWGELQKQGIDPYSDLSLSFGGTHDRVVYAVLDGRVDAGTIRTDTLERMADEGKVDLAEIRVIAPNRSVDAREFPFLLSTDLYPEWPFASLPKTSPELADAVAVSLLAMPAASLPAIAARGAGWSIPLNYQPVHDLLKGLRVGLYEDFGKITLSAVLRLYWAWMLSGALITAGLLLATLYVVRLNRKLRASRRALTAAKDELEARVQERTEELEKTNSILALEVEERKLIQQLLERITRDHRLLLDSAGEGIFGIDAKGRTTFVNPRAVEMLGWSEQELLGDGMHELICHTGRDGERIPSEECPLLSVLRSGTQVRVADDLFWRKDGTRVAVEYTSTPIEAGAGILGAVVVFSDITERKLADEQLRRSAAVFESTAESIVITDAHKRIVMANHAFTRTTGYTLEEIKGLSPGALGSGRHDQAFFDAMWKALETEGHWRGEIWNRRKNGEVFPEWLVISPVKNQQGRIINYICVFSDISSIKRTDEHMEYLAYHDPLTRLPNRLLFRDRLQHAVITSGRSGRRLAILFLDLDGFKAINDTEGHHVGDRLLQQVARKLQTCLRQQDTVARMGGDEFTVLLEDVSGVEAVEQVASKILTTMREPCTLNGKEYLVTASLGISRLPQDGDDPWDLLQHADAAMYQAKRNGRNQRVFYSPVHAQPVRRYRTG